MVMRRSLRGLTVALCLWGLLAGCDKGQKERASLSFYVGGAKAHIENLRQQLPKRDYYAMVVTTPSVQSALEGLPDVIDKPGVTRAGERKAAVEKAIEIFKQLRPVLEGLKYDEADANAKLNEIVKLLDEAVSP